MKENVFFIWSGKIEKGDFFHVCLLSLQRVSDCKIVVYTPALEDGSKELLESMGINAVSFDKSHWDNRRMNCKINKVREYAYSLTDGDRLLVCDGDLLFLRNPFTMFENDFDFTYTTRNVAEPVFKVNAGCWGLVVNDNSKNFMDIYASNMDYPTWEPYKMFRINHPSQTGLDHKDWWIDQDFLIVLNENKESVNSGNLGIDIKVFDSGPEYNYLVNHLSKLQISVEIESKRNCILHFKGGSMGRWIDGNMTWDTQMIDLIGKKIELFKK